MICKKIPVSSVTSNITIVMTGMMAFTFRIKVAAYVFKLAAWIAGVGFRMDITND